MAGRPPRVSLVQFIQAFVDLRLEGKTYKELAEYLHITTETVKAYRGIKNHTNQRIPRTWTEDKSEQAFAYLLKNRLIKQAYMEPNTTKESPQYKKIMQVDREATKLLLNIRDYNPPPDTPVDRALRDIALMQLLEQNDRTEVHRKLMEGLDQHFLGAAHIVTND